MAYYLLNLTITNVTFYLHHKFSASFLLYIVTKDTGQINQIITIYRVP